MHITIQRSDERGKGEHGWLHTRHSFSFASYYNPKRMEFGMLRVLNEDVIEQGKGFGSHGHDNMEIVTIVLEGTLEHKDSMSNQGLIPAGDVQRMSAGTGIIHSEFNHSKKDKVHLLQIWVLPDEEGIPPEYEQRSFPEKDRRNKLQLVVSGQSSVSGRKSEALHMHQDARFFMGSLDKGIEVTHKVAGKDHGLYIFVIKGALKLQKEIIRDSDAAEITGAGEIRIKAEQPTEVLLIEVLLR